jgi:hypothetical protein
MIFSQRHTLLFGPRLRVRRRGPSHGRRRIGVTLGATRALAHTSAQVNICEGPARQKLDRRQIAGA